MDFYFNFTDGGMDGEQVYGKEPPAQPGNLSAGEKAFRATEGGTVGKLFSNIDLSTIQDPIARDYLQRRHTYQVIGKKIDASGRLVIQAKHVPT